MSDTQQIKDKIDIVDFISEYAQLKPAGVNHKGLCPFHQEKTPSFMVNRDRQSFHCFGCGKSGDIFTFLQEMEGMEFIEALKHLASRAGVDLTRESSELNTSQKNRIIEINTEAARFFHNFLLAMNQAKGARDYLQERGLKEETIEEWQIGFVPNQWDLLTQYLLKKGRSIDDLIAAGFTIKRDGADFASGKGFYDRFRGRIMFPIWDIHGRIVGFTGRILVETDKSGGKYVNTPQTLVYDKSRIVFGLNKAKQEIRQKDLIIMVEGQMDVIACHQAGMKNVIAISGTALTEQQVGILKRYSNKAALAFDADAAGLNSADRGIGIALKEGFDIKLVIVPPDAGKDPDEILRKNPAAWFKAVDEAKDIMEWFLYKVCLNKKLDDYRHKDEIANEFLSAIAMVQSPIVRDHWVKELSHKINVDSLVLRDKLKQLIELKKTSANAKKFSNSKDNPIKIKDAAKDRMDLLVERFFVLLLRFPKLITNYLSSLADLDLSTGPYFYLYRAINEEYNKTKSADIGELKKQTNLNSQGENIVEILLMKGELDFCNVSEDEAKKEAEQTALEIKKEFERRYRQKLQVEIEKAEQEGNQEKLKQLINEFQKIEVFY
ncbi:MAG: DNA primase [Patescibacteria group bacterium]